MKTVNISIFTRPLVKIILIIILIISAIYSQDLSATKTQPINIHWAVGVEYAKNSEIGILGQYNLNNNISITGKLRRCTHDKKIYFSPEIKYYFSKKIYDIRPFVNIRYGKIHYDLKWSDYDYNVGQRYDPFTGQYEYYVYTTAQSGSSLINSPALSISGGGEYNINNIGIYSTIGISYYTKIEGEFKNKNKFFFTIGALYYFSK